jgi:hypothetical protein
MKEKTREEWVRPIIISLGTGVLLLILGIYLTAWATGTQLRPPFTGGWLEALLSVSVQMPLWMILVIAAVIIGVGLYLRQGAKNKTLTDANSVSAEHSLNETKAHPVANSAGVQEDAGETSPVTPVVQRPRPPSILEAQTPSEVVIPSSDNFSIRIQRVADGLQLTVENHRLTSIHQIRLIISTACSFDARHGAFRESIINAVTLNFPNHIRPSGVGSPIRFLWKESGSRYLLVGSNNMRSQLAWPELDKSEVERWRLSLRILASNWPPNASGLSTPLEELRTDIVVLWDRARNELSIEKPETSSPRPNHPAFPTDGADGTHRKTVRFIMRGTDQLLAYETTRDGLPDTRFLVVRNRPEQLPQSVETPDRATANAKWSEWYQEWKKEGFGGASGNGLDGGLPF